MASRKSRVTRKAQAGKGGVKKTARGVKKPARSAGKQAAARKKAAPRKKTVTGKRAPARKKTPARAKAVTRKKAAPRKKTVTGKRAPARKRPVSPARRRSGAPPGQRPPTVPPVPVEPPEPKWTPSPAYGAYQQALELLHAKKYRPAQKALLAILKTYPEVTEVIARVEGFLKVCDRAIETEADESPQSTEAIFNLAVFHHNRGQFEEALESFTEALKRAKGRTDHILYAMAATEVALGNAEDGLNHLEKAVELNPENRFFAQNDSDFESLAEHPRFKTLVESD